MRSIKPGRGPSLGGAAISLAVVIFGSIWTAIAISLTSTPMAPMAIKIGFPLFGLMFVLIGVLMFSISLHNATAKNRFSTFDITSSGEESDPLNEVFGSIASKQNRETSTESDINVEEKLRELDDLRDKNLVTPAEYAAQRQRILDQI